MPLMLKDNLPSEVIGIILRQMEDDTRGVVLASATSRQWRDAMTTCLSRILLTDVLISAQNLNLLLNSCPYMEQLTITNVKLVDDDVHHYRSTVVDFTASCLKTACLAGFQIDQFVLRADTLEELELRGCTIGSFQIIGSSKWLKALKIDDGHIGRFEIGEINNKHLEVLEVRNIAIVWPGLFELISSSAPNLVELTLWNVTFKAEWGKLMSLNCIGSRYSNLIRLSLSLGVNDDMVSRSVQGGGSLLLEKVEKVFIKADLESDVFPQWLVGIYKMCRNTRELVLLLYRKELKGIPLACNRLANIITDALVRMFREHPSIVFKMTHD